MPTALSMRFKIVLYIGICALSVGMPLLSHAASLYLVPDSQSAAVGDFVSVTVRVTSSDAPINAISGTVSFPSDILQVNSFGTGSSIVNLWVRQPSFSNQTATVNFEGLVLNPGFQGTGGKILSIVFKAKSQGSATISFASSAVLAADGNGTNVLQNAGTASIVVHPYSGNGASGDIRKTSALLPPPAILEYPTTTLPINVPITIRGTSTPSSTVLFSGTMGNRPLENHSVRADAEGKFSFTYPYLSKQGIYHFIAVAQDAFGAQSVSAPEIVIAVADIGTAAKGVSLSIAKELLIALGLLALISVVVFGGKGRIRIEPNEWRRKSMPAPMEKSEAAPSARNTTEQGTENEMPGVDWADGAGENGRKEN